MLNINMYLNITYLNIKIKKKIFHFNKIVELIKNKYFIGRTGGLFSQEQLSSLKSKHQKL